MVRAKIIAAACAMRRLKLMGRRYAMGLLSVAPISLGHAWRARFAHSSRSGRPASPIRDNMLFPMSQMGHSRLNPIASSCLFVALDGHVGAVLRFRLLRDQRTCAGKPQTAARCRLSVVFDAELASAGPCDRPARERRA